MPQSVSIIIPNYNHGHLLRRAVAAHLSQTLAPLEVIIVDDASTDDSAETARALEREHACVTAVAHASNLGPNAGINTGLAMARGEYVVFAAADDIVEPTFLERSVAVLERHPAAAFSFLDPSRLMLASGKKEHVPLALAAGPRFFPPQQFEDLFRRNTFTVSSNTVVYRRAAIGSLGGFRPDLEWQADWMANFVLAFRHGAVYIPEALAHFVVNPAGYGERGVRSPEGQRRLLGRCLSAIETDYGDVAARFHAAGLLPEMRLRTLIWLARSPSGRRYLSFSLVSRLLQREIWSHLRPITPLAVRRWMRRRVASE